MKWWEELKRRAGYLAHREGFDRELDDEIRFHLESRVEELMRDGLSQSDARARARREFGPQARVREDTRGAWQIRWLEDLFSDSSYAARALRRNPGFAAAAILSLALGIGANTIIFSLTMEFLFSQPSVHDSAALKYLLLGGNSHSDIQEYRFVRDSHVFQGVAGLNEETEANWRNGDHTERVWAASVTDNFFDVVGVPIAFGRPIHTGEQHEVVLNYAFWKSRWGGDPGIVGRKLILDGQLYTISGVLPADHRTLTGFGFSPDLYKTFSAAAFPLAIYVRLRDGMSRAEAYGRTQQLCKQLDHVYPQPDFQRTNGLEIRAVAGLERLNSISMIPFTAFFGMLMVVVGLVLVIACANVASLLLARAASREQEFAVRQAIGAGRSRIVRQLLAESLLLSALGTLAGLGLNAVAAKLLNGIRFPLPVPLRLHIQADWRLLAYSAAIVIITAILCGLIPALRSTKRDVGNALKLEERQMGSGRLRLQRILVSGQLAVSVLLLTVGFLFLKNLMLASTMNPGFDVHHTTWAYMRLVPEKYTSVERIDPVIRAALEKLRALPGVDSAATLRIVPFNDQQTMGSEVRIDSNAKAQISYLDNAVGPDYFKTMGIPMVGGREFLPSDRKGAPAVVIMNENLAHRLFGDKNPVGHTIQLHNGPLTTIVGIAKNSKYFTMGEENALAMYPCYFQSDHAIVNLNFMARSSRPPTSLIKEMSAALGSVDPTAAIDVKPMEKSMAIAMLPSQVGGMLLGSMGILALLLASVGLYGVLIYSVSRRLREFGLRMALGAAPVQVFSMILRNSFWMLGGGMATGLALAAVATPSLTLFLVPEISPHDLATFGATVVVLGAVTAAASISPVLRAVRVDPAVALRYE